MSVVAPFGFVGAPIVARRGQQGSQQTIFGGGEVLFVAGVEIGSLGEVGTIYEGFKLTGGDDFEFMPNRWHGRNLTGKYSTSYIHGGNRQQSAAVDQMMYVDPTFRGARATLSPTPLGYDRVSIVDSCLRLTASEPEAGIMAYLPTTYTGNLGDGTGRPKLLSGALQTGPHYMLSAVADFVLEYRQRVPAGVHRGYWGGMWMSCLKFWPDDGEIDLYETFISTLGVISGKMNVAASPSDGAGVSFETVAQPVQTADTFNQFVVKKVGGTISFYDDLAVPGTLALRGSTTTRVSRIKKAHDIRFQMAVSTIQTSQTYTAADWPSHIDIDWWRAWTPAAAGNNSAIQVLPPIDLEPGDPWTATLPSTVSLFGSGAGVEQYMGFWDDLDGPGRTQRDNTTKVPSSMTVDLTTRAVTGTSPTTEGGLMGILLTYAYNDGTPAGRAIQPYRFAPANNGTIFGNQSIDWTDAVDLDIVFADFHSGNLGPHTYHVTKTGGAWLTITGNDTDTVNIAGSAPSADETVTLDISCTNAIGQTVTIQRTITVAEVVPFDPDTWAGVIEYWDASDGATVFSDSTATTPAVAGSNLCKAWVGKKLGAVLSQTADGDSPDYITDGLNSKPAIKFTVADVDRLTTTDATVVAEASGSDNPVHILVAFRRGTPGVSVGLWCFTRDDAGTVNDRFSGQIGASNVSFTQRLAAGANTQATSAVADFTTDTWEVLLYSFMGTTMTIRHNGVVVLDAAAQDTNSLTIHRFALGAIFENTGNTWALPFGGAIGEIMVIDGTVALADANLADAEAYLMAKWL